MGIPKCVFRLFNSHPHSVALQVIWRTCFSAGKHKALNNPRRQEVCKGSNNENASHTANFSLTGLNQIFQQAEKYVSCRAHNKSLLIGYHPPIPIHCTTSELWVHPPLLLHPNPTPTQDIDFVCFIFLWIIIDIVPLFTKDKHKVLFQVKIFMLNSTQ